jgi:CubicO group peptidase (beta-lactamase class C family)
MADNNTQGMKESSTTATNLSRRKLMIGAAVLSIGTKTGMSPVGASSEGNDSWCAPSDNPNHEMWPHPTNPYEASVAREQYEHSLQRKSKKVCSAIFIQGRDPDEYIQNDQIGYREPYFEWDDIEIDIDHDEQLVTVWADGAPPKRAKFHDGLGSTMLPDGAKDVLYDPVEITPNLPSPDSIEWPLGNRNATADPAEIDRNAMEEVLSWAFDTNIDESESEYPDTRGIVVIYDGQIVAERYAEPFDKDTVWKCWSMGKSTVGTLFGILHSRGHLNKCDPAPVPEWYRRENDPRQKVTNADLLQMAGGIRNNHSDQEDTIHMTKNDDHQRGYIAPIDIAEFSANQALEYEPGTEWEYRNVNPYLIGKIVRATVEEVGEEHLTFPQRALYDKIGARNVIHETDPYGNFLFPGFNYLTPRDWARYGLLHLREGTLAGNEVFSPEWIDILTTPAPAAEENDYGTGFMYLNNGNVEQIPDDAYWASGAQSNRCYIIPSEDVTIVRMGRESEYDLHDLAGRILDAIN